MKPSARQWHTPWPVEQKAVLADLLGILPELVWVREAGTGKVLQCDSSYETLWGRLHWELGRNPLSWMEAIHEEDRPLVMKALRRESLDGQFDLHYRVVHSDGAVRWIHDRALTRPGMLGVALEWVGIAQDVTAAKNAEAAVRVAFDALHSSVNGVILTDRTGRINYANPSFVSLFGYGSTSGPIGQKAEGIFARDDIEEIADVVKATARSSTRTREFKVKRTDGAERIVEVMSTDIHDSQSKRMGSMASFVDITARKRLEAKVKRDQERLRRLNEQLTQVEEQERRRIADRLHDTAVQNLSLANIKLGALRRLLDTAGFQSGVDALEKARELLVQGIRECRLVMAQLLPPLLYEAGLEGALKDFAGCLSELHQVTIDVETDPQAIAVPETLRGPLFRAARELVLNACKHAGGSHIRITWHHTAQWFRMGVCDNGKGFHPQRRATTTPGNGNGLGLFSLREQMRALGGHLEIESHSGKGSKFWVCVPRKPAGPIGRRRCHGSARNGHGVIGGK